MSSCDFDVFFRFAMVEVEELPDDASPEETSKVVEETEEEKEDKPVPAKAAEPAVPETPAMPQMKMSQLLPMGIMFGLQKFNLEELGYVRHAEVAYVLAQLICLGVLGLLYQRIQSTKDSGSKLKIPEVTQFGQVVKPAVEQTPKEYDMEKFLEQAKQLVMGAGILGGIYCKWGYLMPLVLQVFMTPLQLYESPLFQLHIMGAKDITRPFPTPSPFGLPSAPEAPAEAVEVVKAAEDKKSD